MNKTIRWQQRFQNLEKAYQQLTKGLAITHPSDIEKQGIIKSFEFTFELAWKTIKDYLESQNVEAKFPRDVIKQGFHYEIIVDGESWLDMLEQRNLISHTYDEATANKVLAKIKDDYFQAITQVIEYLRKQ